MVCETCKVAGSLNRKGMDLLDNDRVWDADALFDKADEQHAQCKGCDCQHITRTKMN